MAKKISIKDVAKLAGVSTATVSRVVNNTDYPVKEETKAVVEKAVKELKFQPNRWARSLSQNKSNIIGVIVHDISSDYFSELLKGIEGVLFDNEFVINVFDTARKIDKQLKALNLLKADQADAVIFPGGIMFDDSSVDDIKQTIEGLKNQGCNIVAVTDNPFAIKNIDIGNTLATRTITEYLINKGHRNIAYLHGPELMNAAIERLNGFKEAMKNRQLKINEDFIIPGDFTFESGRKAALNIINKEKNISAVVASNDESALGLLWELHQRNIDVPGDISVVGIDNIPLSKYYFPPLTTINLPLHELGQKIGRYISAKLQGDQLIDEIDVHVGLVERKSVKDIN